jgi:phosphoribosylglycinamide formyltransferase-1
MRAMKRIVILISGRGSNMQAILEVAKEQQWPVMMAAVISNRPNAGGLTTAAECGIATAAIVPISLS